MAVREYLNKQSWKSTIAGVVQTVEDVTASRRAAAAMELDTETLSGEQGAAVSRRTAQRWLGKLGWCYDRDKKGYFDGHEREDVVKYRNDVFLPRMAELEPRLIEFKDDGQIEKPQVEGPQLILVTHDESSFSANDDSTHHWKKRGTQPLKSKSKGKGLMVSEFLTAADGRLRFTDSKTGSVDEACEILRYGSGVSDDGYWTAEKMVRQVRERAIPIFEKRFPGKTAIFAFDNSSNHAAFAADALVASRMNLKPGGKQPKMRPTSFNGIPQAMVFTAQDAPRPELVGQPKGMQQVLVERGLWIDGLTKQCGKAKGEKGDEVIDRCRNGVSCCTLRILENQTDFAGEVSMLQTTIESAGHLCLFYPEISLRI